MRIKTHPYGKTAAKSLFSHNDAYAKLDNSAELSKHNHPKPSLCKKMALQAIEKGFIHSAYVKTMLKYIK